MKFKNLIKENVEVDKKAFLNAINARKPMAVTAEGEILFGKPDELPAQPYIFVGTPKSLVGTDQTPPTPLAKILGDNYEVKDEGEKVSIYAGRAWQELLAANAPFAAYQDTTADGIAEFTDVGLEDLIWYSCEFGINYREVAEYLEKSVEGTVLCVESERPYSFNGSAFIHDIEEARVKARQFITDTLKKRIEQGEIDLSDLSPEEEEALRFFSLI